ncbi:MAG: hypothetical protein K8F91_22435, partial [Candidatus Obscuribacterales bacterium]|nr:hypothetical protein [Candidatus Obscuribacterales bacterium]
MTDIKTIIEKAFENRNKITPDNVEKNVKEAVDEVLDALDHGDERVANKQNGEWVVNEWLKKAVLLSFRIEDNCVMPGGYTNYFDKVQGKFQDYTDADFRKGGFRVVPPAAVRRGSYIAGDVVV